MGAPQIALGFLKDDGGLEDLIVLPLTDLTFEARSGHKPSINTNFGKPVFKGDLAFLNGIMAVLPSTLFGNPPQLVVDDTHAEASCGVTLPAFGFGMFDFRNVGLDADLTIRFDPSNAAQDTDGSNAALAFAFNFGTPQKPFSCAVALLEGQGSFGVVVTPAGLIVDASLAFGGGFELDLIVVSGGVSITAGVHLRKTPTEFEVAGFVHVTGGVEVLGLIGITLDAMLVLTWNTHVFTGKLSVTVGVHVLFFHTSVSLVWRKPLTPAACFHRLSPCWPRRQRWRRRSRRDRASSALARKRGKPIARGLRHETDAGVYANSARSPQTGRPMTTSCAARFMSACASIRKTIQRI